MNAMHVLDTFLAFITFVTYFPARIAYVFCVGCSRAMETPQFGYSLKYFFWFLRTFCLTLVCTVVN